MKIIKIFLLSIFCLFPSIVFAEGKDTDSWIKCYYEQGTKKMTYYYNATDNTFKFDGNVISNHSWENKLISSNFINKTTNELSCPNISTKVETVNNRSAKTIISVAKTGGFKPKKVESNNIKLTKTVTCVYSSGSSNHIEFILDTSKKDIVSHKVNGMDTTSNPFSYDEIYDGSKCIDIKEIYSFCYDGSHGGDPVCHISKEDSYTGTGSSSSNPSLDNDLSSGVENDDNVPDSEDNLTPGDEVYGCDVIPYDIKKWILDALNLVKYLALALVIVLGVLDFIKAAASGEADAMKKSGNSFLKRIIAVVILFLVPVIVELVLNLVDIYGAGSTCLPK